MKKVVIIVRPDRLEDLKEALYNEGVESMTISGIMGHENQRDRKSCSRGKKMNVNLLCKFKIETITGNDMVKSIIRKVKEVTGPERRGDEKIFVIDMEDPVLIETLESVEGLASGLGKA